MQEIHYTAARCDIESILTKIRKEAGPKYTDELRNAVAYKLVRIGRTDLAGFLQDTIE